MKDIVDQLIDLAHAISLGHDEDGDEGVHRAAAAEITRLRALVTPQPIETAPKRIAELEAELATCKAERDEARRVAEGAGRGGAE